MPNYNEEREDLWALGALGVVLWAAMGVLIAWNALHQGHDGGTWRGTASLFAGAIFYSYTYKARPFAWACWLLFAFSVAGNLLVELVNRL